jgi:hypothetical protein
LEEHQVTVSDIHVVEYTHACMHIWMHSLLSKSVHLAHMGRANLAFAQSVVFLRHKIARVLHKVISGDDTVHGLQATFSNGTSCDFHWRNRRLHHDLRRIHILEMSQAMEWSLSLPLPQPKRDEAGANFTQSWKSHALTRLMIEAKSQVAIANSKVERDSTFLCLYIS